MKFAEYLQARGLISVPQLDGSSSRRKPLSTLAINETRQANPAASEKPEIKPGKPKDVGTDPESDAKGARVRSDCLPFNHAIPDTHGSENNQEEIEEGRKARRGAFLSDKIDEDLIADRVIESKC